MFGTNASLAYGPQIQMRLIITDRTKIIYSMYREGEVSVHRACCERTTQPYSLGGGRYDLSRLLTSRCYNT